jgi:cell division protein ZapA
MAVEKPNLVHVEIFGQTYAVKAGADGGYVEELAAFVDAQMREISRSGGAVDSVRIAVLAALNIADECFRAKTAARKAEEEGGSRVQKDVQARAERMAQELASAIEG